MNNILNITNLYKYDIGFIFKNKKAFHSKISKILSYPKHAIRI